MSDSVWRSPSSSSTMRTFTSLHQGARAGDRRREAPIAHDRGCDGEEDVERGASLARRRHPHSAVEVLDDASDDGEAEARPLARLFSSEEGVEDALCELRRYSRARVGDDDLRDLGGIVPGEPEL